MVSKYDTLISETLNITLETLNKCVSKMSVDENAWFYFYMGGHFGTSAGVSTIVDSKEISDSLQKAKYIINKYLREYKLERINEDPKQNI